MSQRVHTAEGLSTSASTKRARLAAVLVVAVAAVLLAWLVFRGDDNQAGEGNRAPASAVSVGELQAIPNQVGHDVFWAGRKPGFTYELTRTTQGNIFIRYLSAGVEVNDPRPDFVTVGTYPKRGAYGIVKKIADNPGSKLHQLAGGGIAVVSDAKPNSVYVAYPGKDLQIEVYHPSPSRALRLALSGQVRPLD
jgi:hypothetical protein